MGSSWRDRLSFVTPQLITIEMEPVTVFSWVCSSLASASKPSLSFTREDKQDYLVQFSYSVLPLWPLGHAGFPVHHQLPEPTQTHVHPVCVAIQPSHPLPSPSPPAFNLSQHQGLFQWVGSSHQVAKVMEFQLQHQSFQRISGGRVGQQWPAAGSEALSSAVRAWNLLKEVTIIFITSTIVWPPWWLRR